MATSSHCTQRGRETGTRQNTTARRRRRRRPYRIIIKSILARDLTFRDGEADDEPRADHGEEDEVVALPIRRVEAEVREHVVAAVALVLHDGGDGDLEAVRDGQPVVEREQELLDEALDEDLAREDRHRGAEGLGDLRRGEGRLEDEADDAAHEPEDRRVERRAQVDVDEHDGVVGEPHERVPNEDHREADAEGDDDGQHGAREPVGAHGIRAVAELAQDELALGRHVEDDAVEDDHAVADGAREDAAADEEVDAEVVEGDADDGARDDRREEHLGELVLVDHEDVRELAQQDDELHEFRPRVALRLVDEVSPVVVVVVEAALARHRRDDRRRLGRAPRSAGLLRERRRPARAFARGGLADLEPLGVALVDEDVHGEVGGVLVGWNRDAARDEKVGEPRRRAVVDEAPGSEEGELVEFADHGPRRLVDGADDGAPQVRGEVDERLDDVERGRGVEPRRRLVDEHDGQPGEQVHADGESFFLPARDADLERRADDVVGFGAQAELGDDRVDAGVFLGVRHVSRQSQLGRVEQRLAHGEDLGEDLVLRRHGADLLEGREVGVAAVDDDVAVEERLEQPRLGRDVRAARQAAGEEVEQGRFARARGAHEDGDRAAVEGERDVLDGELLGARRVSVRHVADLDIDGARDARFERVGVGDGAVRPPRAGLALRGLQERLEERVRRICVVLAAVPVEVRLALRCSCAAFGRAERLVCRLAVLGFGRRGARAGRAVALVQRERRRGLARDEDDAEADGEGDEARVGVADVEAEAVGERLVGLAAVVREGDRERELAAPREEVGVLEPKDRGPDHVVRRQHARRDEPGHLDRDDGLDARERRRRKHADAEADHHDAR
mmetsp:Transcript_15262/g.61372  ORF Transcript_15262/g.61372 Transcript_15262/m.61372 type:complete len:849 (-) Transcript_15262:599-3145(-)